MKLHISAALCLSISCVASICSAILPGELLANNGNNTSDQNKPAPDGERDANPNRNLTLTSSENGSGAKLDLNSTFYYEADTFLFNKSTVQPEAVEQTSGTSRVAGSKNRPAAAEGGRRGRMLDLDALVGDLEASRAQKELRAQITSRQSRNLSPRQHHLDIGGGKRLHIQGFIPIVGVKDDDNGRGEDGDKADGELNGTGEMQLASSQNQLLSQTMPTAAMNYGNGMRQLQQQQPKLKMMPTSGGLEQSSLMKANGENAMFELPYGQSSIGHATFNVQRLLNTEPAASQTEFSQMQQMAQTLPSAPSQPAKFTAGIVDTLKRPIQKLTNTFGGSNNNDRQQQKMAQQQQNCLCVPFYMCKNGLISESGLGRSQIQQLIAQQQQQQQSPRQLLAEPSVMPSSFGSLIDERSSERELITMTTTTVASPTDTPAAGSTSVMNNLEMTIGPAPESSSLDLHQSPPDGAQNQKPTHQTANQQSSSSSSAFEPVSNFDSPTSANSSLNQANFLSPDEMTSLNQATNDYSQDILGRMLGLKANSRVAMLGSASQIQAANSQQEANGVCGIWRTCCNVPANLLSSLLPTDGPNRQVAALQRYQQPVVLPGKAQQLSSPMNSGQLGGYEPAMSNLRSLYHQSSPQQQQQLRRFGPNLAVGAVASTSVQQYARAPPVQQPLQSFQAPIAPSQQQLRQQLTQVLGQNQRWSQMQQPSAQLGTRKLLEGRCGLRQSAGINGRVQNYSPGSENWADFGEYPAQAAILKRLNGSESLFVCSGALISQSWVATAAHCIRKHLTPNGGGGGVGGIQNLRVRLGEWDVHRDDEFYPHIEKDVRDLIIHPDFIQSNLINDIALIRLESPIDSTLPHVMPACLPAQDETFARQRCWVAGWGKDAFGQSGSFQSTLQEVELPVWSHGECEQALKQTRLGPHYRLHPGFVCAGGEQGKDACEGDGGSGLYCSQEGGAIKVAGLVSWGISCGQRNVPGVFVSMPHYRSWIENIISIDEDIYSSYNPLPVNGLISERNAAPEAVKNSSQTVDELKVSGNANGAPSTSGSS